MNRNNIEFLISSGMVEYCEAINFMENRVSDIIENGAKSLIWFLEHSNLYTAGVSAKGEDLLYDMGLPVFQANRGGKYTYHGCGIRVIYLMLNLKFLTGQNIPDVRKFINNLEEWVINSLARFGVVGEIRNDRVGIWVQDRKNSERENKIAAMGIKIKRGVAYHGIAININPDLKYFSGIVPCGIKEEKFGVTSLKNEGVAVDMKEMDLVLIEEFWKVNFGTIAN